MRKPVFVVSDTNQAEQSLNMARDLKFRIERYCTILVAKTKAQISFTVTAKLICVFVFAYAKSRFSHDAAHIYLLVPQNQIQTLCVLGNFACFFVVCCFFQIKLYSIKSFRNTIKVSNTLDLDQAEKICWT